MRLQDFIASATEDALRHLFHTARHLPADKLSWKPLDNGRSCLDQLQECAQFPLFLLSLIRTEQAPTFDPESSDKMERESEQWDTLEKCEAVCTENTGKLSEAIRGTPDERLDVEIPHPFDPGKSVKLRNVMLWHYWNLVYHTGQINYVQTLLGDFEMH